MNTELFDLRRRVKHQRKALAQMNRIILHYSRCFTMSMFQASEYLELVREYAKDQYKEKISFANEKAKEKFKMFTNIERYFVGLK